MYKCSAWACRQATHTMSQMMQAPSQLAETHSLSSLLILIQATVALCSFRVSSSRWPCGCSSQTRTCNRWIQTHYYDIIMGLVENFSVLLCVFIWREHWTSHPRVFKQLSLIKQPVFNIIYQLCTLTCPSPPPLMILLQFLVPAMAVTPILCALWMMSMGRPLSGANTRILPSFHARRQRDQIFNSHLSRGFIWFRMWNCLIWVEVGNLNLEN